MDPNPSSEIVSQLPDVITGDAGGTPDIRIHRDAESIKISYYVVSQLVAE